MRTNNNVEQFVSDSQSKRSSASPAVTSPSYKPIYPEEVSGGNPTRRNFLKTGALAGAGALVLSQTACAVKNISFYVATITGALGELSPLLPGASVKIATAVKVANDFLTAYKRGDFANATTIFENLVSDLAQIASDVGISGNPTLKIVFAIVSVAAHTIAALLIAQTPAPVLAQQKARASQSQIKTISTVERLADPAALDSIFTAATL